MNGECLDWATGASESEAFWCEFMRSLVGRGLKGVQLVISDSHEGLKAAIAKVLSGVSWQRCRVHFMRNLLAHIPQRDKSLVAALVRMVFAQPKRAVAGEQLRETANLMAKRWPKAAELLEQAENDVLAYMAFPSEHWSRIYSTNPLERLNREIKRRTEVVGVFPNEGSGNTPGRGRLDGAGRRVGGGASPVQPGVDAQADRPRPAGHAADGGQPFAAATHSLVHEAQRPASAPHDDLAARRGPSLSLGREPSLVPRAG